MKKTLSLADQVKAARLEVKSWPESVRSATDLRHSDFFHNVQDKSVSHGDHSDQERLDDKVMLEA